MQNSSPLGASATNAALAPKGMIAEKPLGVAFAPAAEGRRGDVASGSRHRRGDRGGGLAFAFVVAAGDGDVHQGAGGEVGEGEGGLGLGDDDVDDLLTVDLGGGDAVAVGAFSRQKIAAPPGSAKIVPP